MIVELSYFWTMKHLRYPSYLFLKWEDQTEFFDEGKNLFEIEHLYAMSQTIISQLRIDRYTKTTSL